MSMERDPSGGREQATFDIDIRFITDNKGIEEATYENDTYQYLLFTDDMPGPIRNFGIKVDGSSDEQGPYFYRGEINLLPTNDDDDFATRAFRSFLIKKEAHPVQNLDYETYVFASDEEYLYIVYQDPDCGIGLVTCGLYDSREDMEEQIQGRLFHGTDDEIEAAMDFLQQQEDMLVELYQAHGLPIEPQRLTVAPLESERVRAIRPEAKVMLSDLAGIEKAKEQLEEIILGLKYPEVLKEWGVERPNGILLYGPPGTGKTTLAEAVANELKADLIVVKSDQIYGKWMGESEGNFQAIINRALTAKRPTVLLFDEIDTIIRPNAGSAYVTVAGLFKQNVGKITERNPKVVLMATTNEPENMDETLLRAGRFDVKIHVEKPGDEGRRAIFLNLFFRYTDAAPNREVFDLMEINTDELVAATEDMTGADITTILRKVVNAQAIAEIRTRREPPAVKSPQILDMITRHRQS
jgi:AAA+ superfamily predicted ATPase